MSWTQRQRLTALALILLVGIVAAGILIIRSIEVGAQSYESQASQLWAASAGGYNDFADQIRGLKPDSSSISAVCQLTQTHLERLNTISLTANVPDNYANFNQAFTAAVQANQMYYRKIIEMCSVNPNDYSLLLSSALSLGKGTEDKYQAAYNLFPTVGSNIQQGAYVDINERLSKIFSGRASTTKTPSQTENQQKSSKPSQPQVKIVEVPRKGYSRDFPPAVGSLVTIDTPTGDPVSFRMAPSQSSPLVTEQESIPDGDQVTVIQRNGDWLYVSTQDDIRGYIRWIYEDTTYVSP